MRYSYDEVIAQHRTIIEILENKDCDQVEGIVRKHIIEPMNLWEDLFNENSPYLDYFDIILSKTSILIEYWFFCNDTDSNRFMKILIE